MNISTVTPCPFYHRTPNQNIYENLQGNTYRAISSQLDIDSDDREEKLTESLLLGIEEFSPIPQKHNAHIKLNCKPSPMFLEYKNTSQVHENNMKIIWDKLDR